MSDVQTVASCNSPRSVSLCIPTIGEIFRIYGPAYLKKFADSMSSDQIKAMVAIMRCRTPNSGIVVYRCQQCQKLHHVLKSCGNRHCPVCQGGKAKAWLQNQLEQLLPCAYFMLTFTYRPSGTSSYKPLPVSAEEFIRRFLQHVLPSGFQKVRHFGFAHPRAKTQWEGLSMLVTVTLNMVYVLTVTAKPLVEKPTLKCPECGGELTCLGFVASAPRRLTEFDTS